ncbi:hypothetical protein CKAH01_14091 [Colletotrichum kahawae]|uniref:Uncharacterized protein n=1 Tax=Colletotrichum kahawae TaxID=34407 RepID=A0AAE0DAR7_COLKA|nr:hypothetical protein CKAH01_14091 [Colletotrichum kahawae]
MALLYNGIWEELARGNARSMRARELRTGGEWCGLVGVACDLCRDRWMLLLRYATPHCVSGSGFVRENHCLGGALLILCWRRGGGGNGTASVCRAELRWGGWKRLQ